MAVAVEEDRAAADGRAGVEQRARRRRSPRRAAPRPAASDPRRPARAGRPGSRLRCSSRSVSRHDGSQPTIGTPRSASGASRSHHRLGHPARLVEQALGDARAPAAAGALEPHRQPAASSSSIAARPIAGSVKVVNESARKTTSPREPRRPRPLAIPAHERLAGEARQRAPAVDAGDALEQRARQPGRFESGAVAAPRRLMLPDRAEQPRAQRHAVLRPGSAARNSDFIVAMSTLSGHSLLHALHSRQRSRISCRRSSPSAARGSGSRRAP